MIPIVQHRLDWTSSFVTPVVELNDHHSRTESMTLQFTRNVALYCSMKDLEGVLHTIPGFENCLLKVVDRDGSNVWTMKSQSKAKGLKAMLSPDPTKRVITRAHAPKNFKNTMGIFDPSLIVLRGSVLEHYAEDFLLRMVDDQTFFTNVCVLWGIPRNMSALAKAFFKVAHQTGENAALSKVPTQSR